MAPLSPPTSRPTRAFFCAALATLFAAAPAASARELPWQGGEERALHTSVLDEVTRGRRAERIEAGIFGGGGDPQYTPGFSLFKLLHAECKNALDAAWDAWTHTAENSDPCRSQEVAVAFAVLEKKIEDGKMLEKMTSEAPKFQAYGLDKITFGMVKGLFGFCQEHGLVLLGMLPYMWDLASGLVGRLGYDPSESEIFVSLAFAGVYTVIETVLELPWSLYSTFVVEERHG